MKLLFLVVSALFGAVLTDQLLQQAAEDPKVLQALFSSFKKDNHRVYKDAKEARFRLKTFRKFVREANKLNQEQSDIKVGVTMFADMSEEEKMSYMGANSTAMDDSDAEELDGLMLPAASSVSHRSRYGPIKNQGRCGSCWAFGAVGVTEGYQSMAYGRYTSLAEQQVLDCSGAGNCRRGGYHSRALEYIRRGHLTASYYYRYTARDGRCSSSGKKNYLAIRFSRVNRVSGGDRGLAGALSRGPAAVLLYNFHGVGIEGYKDGIMAPRQVSAMPRASNHIVTAVGYTSSAWELRNSWGTGWGKAGYFWHSRRINNNIGVSDHAYTISYSKAGREEELEE